MTDTPSTDMQALQEKCETLEKELALWKEKLTLLVSDMDYTLTETRPRWIHHRTSRDDFFRILVALGIPIPQDL